MFFIALSSVTTVIMTSDSAVTLLRSVVAKQLSSVASVCAAGACTSNTAAMV